MTKYNVRMILKNHNIRKSYYYGGDLEVNEARKLTSKVMIIFYEIEFCVRAHKPSDETDDKLEITGKKYSALFSLMDSVFSTLNYKRGKVTEQKLLH